MKLTPATELSRGFWFVRRITGEEDLGRDIWAIGLIQGEFPFLYGQIIAYSDEATISEGLRVERIMKRPRYDITNPNEWEFGPKIEFPDEN